MMADAPPTRGWAVAPAPAVAAPVPAAGAVLPFRARN